MYGVMIVDDEKYVRLWIKNCINWQEHGFEIVGEAMNGYDALEQIAELQPRLVISDMNMPELNGINFMEIARERYPDMLFIILSGYTEFEYMRGAVRNNAVDYLIKPVKANELVTVLEIAKKRLELVDKKRLEHTSSRRALDENLELRREKFLINLLDGHILTQQEVVDKTRQLEIPNQGGNYNVITIRLDEEYIINQFSQSIEGMSMDLYKYAIMNMADEVFSNDGIQNYFIEKKAEIVGVLDCSDRNADAIKDIVNISRQLINHINKYLNISVSIGVGNVTEHIMYINACYAEAKRALDLALLQGDNKVLTFVNISEKIDSEVLNTSVEKAKKYILEHLGEEISLTDIADYVHITPNYFCTLFKNETNENLFDYITNLRIERAMALMKDEHLKTYKIGEKVGYKDPKYFSRVFKKMTGLSPAEYRKSIKNVTI